MICQKATRAHPDGRTGTAAGYRSHWNAKETACDPCKGSWKDRSNEDQIQDRRLYHQYRIRLTEYRALLEAQGGGCAICSAPEAGGRGRFHVDHDHSCCPGNKSCGECVRGLLCHNCNTGIGSMGDDAAMLRKAADYLEGGQK